MPRKAGKGYAVEMGWLKASRWGVGAGINGHACTCRIAGFSASMTSTWDSMSEISAGEPAQRPLHHGSNHFFWTTFSVYM